jgi:hypothetical protein
MNEVYMFSLLLGDETNVIPVILSGNDAVYFFNGLEPSQEAKTRLGEQCQKLWQVNNFGQITRSEQFECVIVSYVVEDRARYKMIDTQIG